MEIGTIIGIGIVGVSLAVLLKQYKPEYSLAISLIVGVLIFAAAAEGLTPVIDQLGVLLDSTQMPREYIEILIKSLGICFITQIACDTCKDAGQGAIATKLEIAGKLSILVLSLPLFQSLLTIVAELLSA
ncbi:stage III sporulation protein AD [Clostridiaceae bacterium NSJ-31]|uniref:Stage III sporulation protein AD n=1 Tax=Ligaoa zhengdingensis TaxID=2763658 RepID=A0A926DWQ4_9FIRM|nr:stage III sporulation AC/AD family protein [Ligaoa zhengdingensis]MBC8545486.1 stage III sporulation protein AD [Ligaoa zhengdingensis]